jgi:hypothetical protein
MMAFSGVRSSWLRLCRFSDFMPEIALCGVVDLGQGLFQPGGSVATDIHAVRDDGRLLPSVNLENGFDLDGNAQR